jgi:hypothetical protein
MQLLIMQQKNLQPPVTSSLLGPNILLSTLFSNTLNPCSSLNVRDKVSHLAKNTQTYKTLVGKPEGKRLLGRPGVGGRMILKWI